MGLSIALTIAMLTHSHFCGFMISLGKEGMRLEREQVYTGLLQEKNYSDGLCLIENDSHILAIFSSRNKCIHGSCEGGENSEPYGGPYQFSEGSQRKCDCGHT